MSVYTYQVPITLQELVKEVVIALEAIAKDKRYAFDMREWSRLGPEGICYVCVAGAWLAHYVYEDPVEVATSTPPLPIEVRRIMILLNLLRCKKLTDLYDITHTKEVKAFSKKWDPDGYIDPAGDPHEVIRNFRPNDPVAVTQYFRELEVLLQKFTPLPLQEVILQACNPIPL
jgi:hypothetical protein